MVVADAARSIQHCVNQGLSVVFRLHLTGSRAKSNNSRLSYRNRIGNIVKFRTPVINWGGGEMSESGFQVQPESQSILLARGLCTNLRFDTFSRSKFLGSRMSPSFSDGSELSLNQILGGQNPHRRSHSLV